MNVKILNSDWHLYLACLVFIIGLDGKITLEKRLKGIYVIAEKLQEARQNLVQAGKEVPIK